MNNNQEIINSLKNIPKQILSITANDDYTLTVVFDNNDIRKLDMSQHLFGVFEILKDINKFKEVFIDEAGNIAWNKDAGVDSSIVWNNRIDLCKDSVYLNSVSIK